jgi:tetratricopeptide (TPR) repeat protein
MGRRNKAKGRVRPDSRGHSAKVTRKSGGRVERLHQADPMGASWRSYPRGAARQAVIDRVKAKPADERSGDDWWQLGEYQIVEGLSSGDETLINVGSQALMKGAHLAPPHAGCLLDLGWLLCYKGLDEMALFYLNKVIEIVPNSRDAWSIRGWACIGSGDREHAINSFARAASLPGAADVDRSTLAALQNGEDLAQLRKEIVFRKFDDEVLRGRDGDPKEAARSGVMQFKQLLERKPGDLDLAYGLAYCHYVLDQFDHAEPLLLRVIGERPDHADALTLLGLIAQKQERPEQQRDYYERAVRADPKHVLANTNLAYTYQNAGEFHAARPLLNRAIKAAPADDPHLPIALDLLGNSYGVIENDFAKEAELHRQAIALDPKRPMFHANLVVALLSAGRAKDAQRALQTTKDARMALPNQSLLEYLVRLYQNRTLHPYEYMQSVDQFSAALGWAALKPLVRQAWDRRNVVDPSERVDFLNALGMMASRTGDHDLALQVWRYGCTVPGGEPFRANVAVELSNMDRPSEALAAADQMPMDTPRSWTILGNIRLNARQYKLALEAYRTALDKDERFLLPISNAISAARNGLLSEELDPFIERLRTDWQSSTQAMSLLGQALALQGRLASAADCFQKAIWSGSDIRTPEELWADEREAEDLSLLGEPDLQDHYAAAKCFLELGRLDLLMQLVSKVDGWPKWSNGDWSVLRAEVYLAANELDYAASIIDKMTDQHPPRIVGAKIAIQRGDVDEADRLIALGLKDESAAYFNHPEGRPDAVFRALAAERAVATGDPERGEDLARDAIRRDPACVRARLALTAALEGRVPEEERQGQIRDGLRRAPGHPALVTALITSLIGAGNPESASTELEAVRPLLLERSASHVAHRLGEAIAVDRLSRMEPASASGSTNVASWPWIEKLQAPLRDWMRGAYLALARSEDLAAAYALYVSKVAEYLLVEKIMVPFRDSIPDAGTLTSDQHRDAARFMRGGPPPSIGGIARLLEAANRAYRSSDDGLTRRFREALLRGDFGDSRTLRDREFVRQLVDLGRARNSAAHLGDHDMAALQAATKCVVSDGHPGLLFSVLRVI